MVYFAIRDYPELRSHPSASSMSFPPSPAFAKATARLAGMTNFNIISTIPGQPDDRWVRDDTKSFSTASIMILIYYVMNKL